MSYIKRLMSLYTENCELEFKITEDDYKMIKLLIRLQLAELIENNASDEKINHFMELDVKLTKQNEEMMQLISYQLQKEGFLPS